MNVAMWKAKGIFSTGLCVFVLGMFEGCVFVEPSGNGIGTRQRVVIQQDYAGYEDIQALSDFSTYLKGLNPAGYAAEIRAAQGAYEQAPSVVNRFKYVLTLFYAGGDETNLKQALSLLGDGGLSEKEAAAFWVFFADHFGAMFKRYTELLANQREQANERAKLGEEVAALRSENDNLKKVLQAKTAQLNKVEGQVNQIKTIEKSILERNQTEDVVKP